MKERLERLLGSEELPWVATFHATCVRILRREIAALGFTAAFTIYDDQDQERLLKTILEELAIPEKSLKPRAAAAFIDGAKNRGQLPDELPRDDFATAQLVQVYARYQQRLQQANALDFGDLLLQTVRLFREQPQILQRWRERFRYILVDEFQDTNAIQYELIRRLGEGHRNLCVVGDDDQSIYRWRGAEIGNILGFERDFAGCVTIRLEQNYRSTQTILDRRRGGGGEEPRPQREDAVDREPGGRAAGPRGAPRRSGGGALRRRRDQSPARRRAAPARHRGLLSDQRPVPGPRGSAAQPEPPLRHVRRGEILLAAWRSRTCWPTCGCWSTRPMPWPQGASSTCRRGGSVRSRSVVSPSWRRKRGAFWPPARWPWNAVCSAPPRPPGWPASWR